MVGLERCHTDQTLFDLAIAATYNGKTDWLAAVISEDRASALIWRRKRGAVLSGYTVNNALPIASDWPAGEIKTGHAVLDRKSEHFRWGEAFARHWWRAYLASHDPTEAYAAWVLFLRSADRRGWVWMPEDVQATNDTGDFFKLKLSHAQLNRSKLKRAMEKRTDKLDKNFLDRRIVAGVGPWGKEA